MQELKAMELPELLDLLAYQTGNYMSMLKSGVKGNDFQIVTEQIRLLQLEIELRRTPENTNTTPNISFTEPGSSTEIKQ